MRITRGVTAAGVSLTIVRVRSEDATASDALNLVSQPNDLTLWKETQFMD